MYSNLIITVIYLVLMFGAGIFFSRNIKNTADYFLAGRSASWFWIMGAIWATNIGFLHGYLAHGGAAYEWGLIQSNFEWFQGPFGYILTGIFFIAFYWRAGIYIVPQFLERRYGSGIRMIYSIAWIILGQCLVVTIGWCAGHQSMVQRNLGARSIYDSKLGYVVASIPKTLGAFLYIVPMIAAPIVFSRLGIFVEKSDAAYGKLIINLLPTGMLGLFIAGLLSAGLSSIGSVLNSASTMLVKDLYERFLVKVA